MAMRQRPDCKMLLCVLYDGWQKDEELKGSLSYIKVMLVISEHQIHHAKSKRYPPSRGKKLKIYCLLLVKDRNSNKQQRLHQLHDCMK